jgi:thiol-disulfide isomerase/thioredoxin
MALTKSKSSPDQKSDVTEPAENAELTGHDASGDVEPAKAPELPSETNRTAPPFWTPGRVLISVVVVGLLIAYGWNRWNTKNTPTTNTSANRLSNTAPPGTTAPVEVVNLPPDLRNTQVKTLDGESLKLADFADKVLIVNLWATWCGPCRLEMPELVKLSNEYKSRGLVVLGLATSYNEKNEPEHVKEYIRSQNVPYKIIWDDGTLAGPLVELVQGRAVIPQSFVISRDGRIVKHFTGFNPYTTLPQMKQAVEDALNEKGKA